MKNIAILGSTGSIGRQALEIISNYKDKFKVEVLTCNNNADLLIKQALEFMPNAVVIANKKKYQKVKETLFNKGIKVFAGEESIIQITEMESIDIVLTAIVGFSGLAPTLQAIKNKKNIALANKESLVVAGEMLTKLAKENAVNIYPVDSEHSAIFQCLRGEYYNDIEKIYLTASGGPFRGMKRNELKNVTVNDALAHPNWNMGDKITIDSATMMNKGLEIIEAKWLFGLNNKQIDVIIHPQSIIHSIVQFIDGSMKAQMGLPDMKLPILYALGYPKRLSSNLERMDFRNFPVLNFELPDYETFPALKLSKFALEKGGNMPCILNAANEVSVNSFLCSQIPFLSITDVVEEVMNKATFIANANLDDYYESDKEARQIAKEIISSFYNY